MSRDLRTPATPVGPRLGLRANAAQFLLLVAVNALLGGVLDTHPGWRARAVGAYRLWRDAGFAVGALTAGLLADLEGPDGWQFRCNRVRLRPGQCGWA
ncbi:hypothetical protein [Micromonospora echinaurantiaca]|uniref:hypothetical protein n=1 Tax=Micromonospora echinaurantiaca TaxID=47857 RepID=UPI00341F692C